jgi:hypothetical protein
MTVKECLAGFCQPGGDHDEGPGGRRSLVGLRMDPGQHEAAGEVVALGHLQRRAVVGVPPQHL